MEIYQRLEVSVDLEGRLRKESAIGKIQVYDPKMFTLINDGKELKNERMVSHHTVHSQTSLCHSRKGEETPDQSCRPRGITAFAF